MTEGNGITYLFDVITLENDLWDNVSRRYDFRWSEGLCSTDDFEIKILILHLKTLSEEKIPVVMCPLGARVAMFLTSKLIDRQDFIRNLLNRSYSLAILAPDYSFIPPESFPPIRYLISGYIVDIGTTPAV